MYRDLHPYCCTFEHCATADRLYESRHEWFQHELEVHRSSWECIEGCWKVFDDLADFELHIKQDHPSLEAMASAIKKSSASPAQLSKEVNCVLCQKVSSLSGLQKHLASHQQQLALFALPPNLDETEADDDLDEDVSIAHSLGAGSSLSSGVDDSQQEHADLAPESFDEREHFDLDTDGILRMERRRTGLNQWAMEDRIVDLRLDSKEDDDARSRRRRRRDDLADREDDMLRQRLELKYIKDPVERKMEQSRIDVQEERLEREFIHTEQERRYQGSESEAAEERLTNIWKKQAIEHGIDVSDTDCVVERQKLIDTLKEQTVKDHIDVSNTDRVADLESVAQNTEQVKSSVLEQTKQNVPPSPITKPKQESEEVVRPGIVEASSGRTLLTPKSSQDNLGQVESLTSEPFADPEQRLDNGWDAESKHPNIGPSIRHKQSLGRSADLEKRASLDDISGMSLASSSTEEPSHGRSRSYECDECGIVLYRETDLK